MKEINYFDTPHSRRKGGAGMANFMNRVLKDREDRRIEESRKQCLEATGYEHEFSDEEVSGEPNEN